MARRAVVDARHHMLGCFVSIVAKSSSGQCGVAQLSREERLRVKAEKVAEVGLQLDVLAPVKH